MKFIAPYMNTWPTPADCCANGGTCVHGENGSTECLCPAAFSGPACLHDVDECLLRRPCGRFSVCTNLYGSFRCDCMPGFQLQADLCVREVSCEEAPCLNGGTCVTRDDLTDVCYCKIGFRGRLCETALLLVNVITWYRVTSNVPPRRWEANYGVTVQCILSKARRDICASEVRPVRNYGGRVIPLC
ncbi:hypothetical protein HPB52_006258 [Rhipicephalus sanguineus]|uniref:EGF-like domain-containing protein n=1 Tax=Rhipicephalus sanguineus TaxID=34632 RepID=A0A9D4SVS4_RHISA|nr:hypothetical protein HPB52_006258 [Rhipicephalus sanguineus]